MPTPTNEDVGKVPTVQDDGSYALTTPSGGGDIEYVTITSSYNGGTTSYTCDKTYAEIKALIENDKIVFLHVNQADTYPSPQNHSNIYDTFMRFRKHPDGSLYAIVITGVNSANEKITLLRYNISSSDSITTRQYYIGTT